MPTILFREGRPWKKKKEEDIGLTLLWHHTISARANTIEKNRERGGFTKCSLRAKTNSTTSTENWPTMLAYITLLSWPSENYFQTLGNHA